MVGIHEDAAPRYSYIAHLLLRDVPSHARIVELGSAPGDQIARLASLGYDATSVDLGEASDQWAGAEPGRMANMLAIAGVRHIDWDLEKVPYPLEDSSFDAVVMTEVYEHLRDYPVHALQEVRRILAPAGRLYFTTPNAAYVMKRLRFLRGQNSVASDINDWIGGLPHARHAREYTFSEVDELMHYAGLHIVRREARHFLIRSGQRGLATYAKYGFDLMGRLRPTLGSSIVIVAERSS